MGGPEQEFAFGFVKFLLAQNLAQIDYADCLIDWGRPQNAAALRRAFDLARKSACRPNPKRRSAPRR
jgi:hypothetical protein